MTLEITCSHCHQNFQVSEAFPGSKVSCPHCSACLILNVKTEAPKPGMVVKATARVVAPSNQNAIRLQAMSHLGSWLDVAPIEIADVLQKMQEGEAYTLWRIPKEGTNLFREISAPCDLLKEIQRHILDRLLYRIPVSNAAHGFVPGRSIVTNAQYHLKTAAAVLNLDLKDAFPSVSETRVKHLYVRYLKIPLKHLGEQVAPEVLNEVIGMLVSLTTHKECLPQGGPCSGYLLNMACIALDKNIYRLLANNGSSYKYTRYADDITISSPMPISEALQKEIQKTVHDCGFQVNPMKAKYAERATGQMLEVTGLILEKGKVRIPASKIEVFRAIIHQASLLETDKLTPEKKLEVQSIVAFIRMVYPKIPQRIWNPYRAYLEKHGLLYPQRATKLSFDLYPHP